MNRLNSVEKGKNKFVLCDCFGDDFSTEDELRKQAALCIFRCWKHSKYSTKAFQNIVLKVGENEGIWKTAKEMTFDFSNPSKFYSGNAVEWKESKIVKILEEVQEEQEKFSLEALLGFNPVEEDVLRTSIKELETEEVTRCFSCDLEKQVFKCSRCEKYCCKKCGGINGKLCIFCISQKAKEGKKKIIIKTADPFIGNFSCSVLF